MNEWYCIVGTYSDQRRNPDGSVSVDNRTEMMWVRAASLLEAKGIFVDQMAKAFPGKAFGGIGGSAVPKEIPPGLT